MKRQLLIDLLAAGRVANLPSVVSNVLLGCGLGWLLVAPGSLAILFPVLAGCCLYVGGCFLNDWADRFWDAAHRPERPLPARRISPEFLRNAAFALMAVGCLLAAFSGWPALLVAVMIAGAIALYTWIHKKTAWGVVPMGLCRGLLYLLGFVAQGGAGFSSGGLVLLMAGGLLFYVGGLSLFARSEAQAVVPRVNRMLGLLMMTLVAFTHAAYWFTLSFGAALVALLALAPYSWLLRRGIGAIKSSIGKGVSHLLANICLVDLVAMLPLAVVLAGGGHWLALLLPLVSGGAYFLAVLLQKVAPAT
ncbi:UbiA family prenyltransferase [Roseibacillus ishigakijimensis]|uniref:UbiA family prenyltransferase n=1 Tax=Roseibacillus ishigakijimensis TaxID=454146 RepID=A0A934VLS3_9BACT|nr:UbiA family prenyltransferase [Roseibacillus ishigakijimensis]MBK1833386.1 UbiA family prenyltransferase [Roseibacillus ishigakijimensis]